MAKTSFREIRPPLLPFVPSPVRLPGCTVLSIVPETTRSELREALAEVAGEDPRQGALSRSHRRDEQCGPEGIHSRHRNPK